MVRQFVIAMICDRQDWEGERLEPYAILNARKETRNDPAMTETFIASRITRGNFLFPTRIEVSPERVLRIKPRAFGQDEESMPMSKVASVQINVGLMFSQIRIDSTGGTNPIVSHGHRKADARRIRELIEKYQQMVK